MEIEDRRRYKNNQERHALWLVFKFLARNPRILIHVDKLSVEDQDSYLKLMVKLDMDQWPSYFEKLID